MKQSKNIIKFIIMIILLGVLPLVPLAVSKIKDEKLLNHLQIEKIKENNKLIKANKLTVAEKLELIGNYVNKEKNIVVTTQVQDMNNENIKDIRVIVGEQLSILRKMGVLVDFNFDEGYMCYNYILKRYNDIEDTSKSVSVYQVNFIKEEMVFEAVIDADTNMIYQYNYYDKNYQDKNYDNIYIFGTKYLGLSEEQTYKYLFGMVGDNVDLINAFGYDNSY